MLRLTGNVLLQSLETSDSLAVVPCMVCIKSWLSSDLLLLSSLYKILSSLNNSSITISRCDVSLFEVMLQYCSVSHGEACEALADILDIVLKANKETLDRTVEIQLPSSTLMPLSSMASQAVLRHVTDFEASFHDIAKFRGCVAFARVISSTAVSYGSDTSAVSYYDILRLLCVVTSHVSLKVAMCAFEVFSI